MQARAWRVIDGYVVGACPNVDDEHFELACSQSIEHG
jgi:hypothetical protein